MNAPSLPFPFYKVYKRENFDYLECGRSAGFRVMEFV